MREILFRGKRVDNGEWVEGSLIVLDDGECRIATSCLQGYDDNLLDVCAYKVDPATVGQYTGLTDKNGKRIFEGDIVEYEDEYGKIVYSVHEARFMIYFDTWCTDFDHIYGSEVEVIGNIHDNPELLEVQDNGNQD